MGQDILHELVPDREGLLNCQDVAWHAASADWIQLRSPKSPSATTWLRSRGWRTS
ncbi:unnamed protein product [Symbiodinium necroappetens]|uniref:Uncharacterized protein n=1 Tax=Symbiodinium necroappetens TaxID=1628268 RepID=A0A813AEQ7_9DINO|nr:unnamed protein product [Symbiodinium necroappetens]